MLILLVGLCVCEQLGLRFGGACCPHMQSLAVNATHVCKVQNPKSRINSSNEWL
jgi:hypothetical protein